MEKVLKIVYIFLESGDSEGKITVNQVCIHYNLV